MEIIPPATVVTLQIVTFSILNKWLQIESKKRKWFILHSPNFSIDCFHVYLNV